MKSSAAHQMAIEPILRDGESLDRLGSEDLKIVQRVTGYRHSMDAILLARFVVPRHTDRVLDLGCGNGTIGLLLAQRHPDVSVVGLEIQPDLANRARRGAEINGLRDRFQIVEGDLRRIDAVLPRAGFDLVVCNPPYRELGRGRVHRDLETRQAKHEISATLSDVVAAIRYALAPKGRASLIYHASRLPDLIAALKGARLEPKLLRFVHSFPGADAEVVLIEARLDGRPGLRALDPLFVYERRGGPRSQEMGAIHSGLGSPRQTREIR